MLVNKKGQYFLGIITPLSATYSYDKCLLVCHTLYIDRIVPRGGYNTTGTLLRIYIIYICVEIIYHGVSAIYIFICLFIYCIIVYIYTGHLYEWPLYRIICIILHMHIYNIKLILIYTSICTWNIKHSSRISHFVIIYIYTCSVKSN